MSWHDPLTAEAAAGIAALDQLKTAKKCWKEAVEASRKCVLLMVGTRPKLSEH